MSKYFTQSDAIDFIHKVFGKYQKSNGGLNCSVKCPYCDSPNDKKKLVIRTDNFKLHCWVCEFKSRNLIKILKEFYPNYLPEYLDKFVSSERLLLEHDKHEEEVEKQKISLPDDFKLLFYNQNNPKFEVALTYLYNRGVKSEDLLYFKIGISETSLAFKNRIIIPSFDDEGRLNYITARAYKDYIRPKYFNLSYKREEIIFNEINLVWDIPLTIVEGPFDLLKTKRTNATCLLGSSLTEKYRLFEKIIENKTPIIMAIDNDAKEKTAKISKLLYDHNIDIGILHIPDMYNDIGEMSSDEFINLINNENNIEIFDDNTYLKYILEAI